MAITPHMQTQISNYYQQHPEKELMASLNVFDVHAERAKQKVYSFPIKGKEEGHEVRIRIGENGRILVLSLVTPDQDGIPEARSIKQQDVLFLADDNGAYPLSTIPINKMQVLLDGIERVKELGDSRFGLIPKR